MHHDWLIWAIVAPATAGVLIRPFGLPEAVWAVLGAAVLIVSGLLPGREALIAVGKGGDVYLFLIGMMILSENCAAEGLFDWVAALAARYARGSAKRLFLLVYVVGTVVTVFLSNDATAVVLTPAVFAATRAAGVANPLPYLFICAFIANAASFVLPISNPANLVLYASKTPPLLEWLHQFALPSLLAIGATYGLCDSASALPCASRSRRRSLSHRFRRRPRRSGWHRTDGDPASGDIRSGYPARPADRHGRHRYGRRCPGLQT